MRAKRHLRHTKVEKKITSRHTQKEMLNEVLGQKRNDTG